jgi:hypothetical protein
VPPLHSFDQLAESLTEYVDSSVDYLSNALLEDGHAPFEAHVSETERRDYFNTLIWNPDGTPNPQGRQFLEQQYGLDEYVRIYRWLERSKRSASTTPQGQSPRIAPGSPSDVTDTY